MLPSMRWPHLALALLCCGGCQSSTPAGSDDAADGDAKAPARRAPASRPIPPPPDDELPPACDARQLAQLAETLAEADPRTRPDHVVRGLADACQMPPFLVHYVELAHRADAAGLMVSSADLSAYRAVLRNACPSLESIPAPAKTAAPEDHITTVFDACRLDRFGIVEREPYLARRPSSLMPLVAYQWLLDQGIDEPVARPIAQAVELFDRRELGPLPRWAGLRLPEVEAGTEPISGGPAVVVARNALRFDGQTLVTLEEGALPAEHAGGPSIAPLQTALEARPPAVPPPAAPPPAGGVPAEPSARPEPPRLLVAADAEVPGRTVLDVLLTAATAGHPLTALAAEQGLYGWGQIPLAAPTREAPPETALVVRIDPAGFEVSSGGAGASPERLGVRAAEGHDAWDYEALAQRARAHRQALTTADTAVLYVGGDTPLGVVARSVVALRSCNASRECVLPHVSLAAPTP